MYSTLDINVNYNEETESWIVQPQTLKDVNDSDEVPDQSTYDSQEYNHEQQAVDNAITLAKFAVKQNQTEQAVVFLNGSEHFCIMRDQLVLG